MIEAKVILSRQEAKKNERFSERSLNLKMSSTVEISPSSLKPPCSIWSHCRNIHPQEYKAFDKTLPVSVAKDFFETSEIEQAFSTLSLDTHQGEVLIRMAESSEPLQVEDDPKEEQHSEGNLFSKVVCEQGTIV
jgi:hypothetical protein